MDTLDLHGIRHHQVDRLVENFILLHDTPLRVIVGNSPRMYELTQGVVIRHGFQSMPENFFNLGSLIINAIPM